MSPALHNRRTFLAAIAGALAAPASSGAQATQHRIGAISSGSPEQESGLQGSLRDHLRERGWIEGQNIVVEWRYAEG